jgi:hypothetical protein
MREARMRNGSRPCGDPGLRQDLGLLDRASICVDWKRRIKRESLWAPRSRRCICSFISAEKGVFTIEDASSRLGYELTALRRRQAGLIFGRAEISPL